MTLRKTSSPRELEVVGLIDIIFLLIVFGITMAVTYGQTDIGMSPSVIPPNKTLTFVFDFEKDPDPELPDRFLMRIRNAPFDIDTLIYLPPVSEVLNLNESDFGDLEAVRTTREAIGLYAEMVQEQDSELPDNIRVEANPNTVMRVINYIFEVSAQYRPPIREIELYQWQNSQGGSK